MKYYVGIIVRHGFQFYLSRKEPFSSKTSDDKWYAYIGPQTAKRFTKREDCINAVNVYCSGKPDILGGVAEVTFFKPNS